LLFLFYVLIFTFKRALSCESTKALKHYWAQRTTFNAWKMKTKQFRVVFGIKITLWLFQIHW